MKKLKLAIKALILKKLDRILVDDLYLAYHGDDLYFVIWDMDQYLRNHIKYNPEKLSSKQIDTAENIRDRLHELMAEHDVDFEHVS